MPSADDLDDPASFIDGVIGGDVSGIDFDSAIAEFEKSDPPEAPADHPVDETGWLVEVGGAKLVYDMPTDAVPAIIELHESMLSGGAQVQLAP